MPGGIAFIPAMKLKGYSVFPAPGLYRRELPREDIFIQMAGTSAAYAKHLW
jgi:hypothetical protein